MVNQFVLLKYSQGQIISKELEVQSKAAISYTVFKLTNLIESKDVTRQELASFLENTAAHLVRWNPQIGAQLAPITRRKLINLAKTLIQEKQVRKIQEQAQAALAANVADQQAPTAPTTASLIEAWLAEGKRLREQDVEEILGSTSNVSKKPRA